MDITVERVEQITLFLENRQGILADLCAHLADHSINIRAMTTLDSAEAGAVRLVVDDPDAAAASLDEVGVAHQRSWCLAVEMVNLPGSFARIARTLAVAGINISFIYVSAVAASGRALGIFGVSDLERSLQLDWSS